MKMLIINGSPRDDGISNTYKALMAEAKYFKDKGYEIEYLKIPATFYGCVDCGNCKQYCNNDEFLTKVIKGIQEADDVLFGSPVYLDMPTPQMCALLTRLNCMAENTNREFFKGKNAYTLATAFCSGTKTCIHTMFGALEMLGFNLPARGSREYIVKWNDKKLRGGNKSSVILLS